MKPTRSANRTETSRRSAAAGSGATGLLRGDASPASAPPHSSQNACSGSAAAPHEGQASASGDPQPRQNLAPGRFSVPHAAQVVTTLRSLLGYAAEIETTVACQVLLGAWTSGRLVRGEAGRHAAESADPATMTSKRSERSTVVPTGLS